jgi:hypothetical protein
MALLPDGTLGVLYETGRDDPYQCIRFARWDLTCVYLVDARTSKVLDRLYPLDKAKNATESTWDDVKAGFKKAYSELKDGFNQARQWVSDKIAP